MKKIFYLCICMLFTFSASAEQWLVLGFDDWPPFTGKGGSPRVAVDMLEEALERLGYKTDIILLRSGQFDQVFTNEQIQISPALWYVKEREEFMIYSDPVFENRLVLVGKEGSGAENASLADLTGKKLGVVMGYDYGEELKTSGATLVEGKNEADLMRQLETGDVDMILTSELLMVYAKRVQKKGFTGKVEVSSTPVIKRPIHFAVKKTTPNAKKIMGQLNAEILKMKEDGTYYDILGISRIVTDIDGDGKPEILLRGDPAHTLNPEEVFYTGNDRNIPESDMEQWFMVDGKFYKTLEDIPANKKEKMSEIAEKQIEFSF